MKTKKLLAFLLFLLPFYGNIFPKNPIQSSDKMKPEWMVKGLPDSQNAGLYFIQTQSLKTNLDDARADCLNQVALVLTQTSKFASSGEIKKQVRSDLDKDGLNETINSEYNFIYYIKTDTIAVVFRKVDEYWEAISDANSPIIYKCHILYAISENSETAPLNQISSTNQYGGKAVWRSALVPGYGQIYKGKTLKGISIIGGEVLLIGGIIFSENRRADYKRRSKETLNISKIKNYLDNADNYALYRNICIGSAAALYIYNIIDAGVFDGRKRILVNSQQAYIAPTYLDGSMGISFALNF